MKFADTHVHLVEHGCGYPDIGEAALLFSCVAKPDEWETQRILDDPRAVRFYGIHPWYAEKWNEGTEKELERILSKDPEAHVGEIGLDRLRPSEYQIDAFRAQVSAASEFGRAVNVHNVGCDGDTAKILRDHGKGCRSIILHSFKNTDVSSFSGINCYYSINPRLLEKSEKNIKAVLGNIPENRLLLETDAPFTSKKFISMERFIISISEVLGISPEYLTETVLDNARRAIR